MSPLPEGVRTYPRWQGRLQASSRVSAMVMDGWERTARSTWGFLVLVVLLGFTVLYIGNLQALAGSRGDAAVHTKDALVDFMNLVAWGAIAIGAVSAAPTLVDDRAAGALELYLTRGMTKAQYLVGKSLSALGITFAGVAGPGLAYYLASWFVFEQHPEGWGLAWLGILGYSALIALVVTDLALGLSAAAGSAKAAVLLLLAGFITLDVLIGDILMLITGEGVLEVASPLSAVSNLAPWLFGTEPPFDFPPLWGLGTWALLLALGWGLLIWRRPRVRGEAGRGGLGRRARPGGGDQP